MGNELVVDPEFKSLIPPLTDVERDGLEQSLLNEGCRDELVVWEEEEPDCECGDCYNGKPRWTPATDSICAEGTFWECVHCGYTIKGEDPILLDGHTRYDICTKHNIEFSTKEIYLADRNAAKEWIINNQFSRRNLRPYQRIELALKLEPLLKERAKKNQGARTDISPISVESKPADTQRELAKIAGVGHDTIHKGKVIAEEASDETKEQLRSGKTTVNKVYRLIKERENRKTRIDKPIPTEQFSIIYADPPWQYEHSISDSRKIENQYPTMTLEDICNISVPAADDSILFLWATSPKLLEALRVMESWGFEYRTNMVWTKDKIGMGYYCRQQHELLLIGKRGNYPTPEPPNRPSSLIESPRLQHSKKPEVVYELIEKMYPEGKKIELFSRARRTNWTSWGNED